MAGIPGAAAVNATTSPDRWCSLCHEYLSSTRPAVVLHLAGEPVVCQDCLRSAVEACKAIAGESIVRGSRE